MDSGNCYNWVICLICTIALCSLYVSQETVDICLNTCASWDFINKQHLSNQKQLMVASKALESWALAKWGKFLTCQSTHHQSLPKMGYRTGALFIDNEDFIYFPMSNKPVKSFFHHVQSTTVDQGKLLQATGGILNQLSFTFKWRCWHSNR